MRVSGATIARWVTDVNPPSKENANRLITILGLPAEDFLKATGSRIEPSPEGRVRSTLISLLAEMDQEGLTQRRTTLSLNSLEAMLTNLGERAGVEECRPHRFRHTAATEHYLAHHDLLAVRSMLGHEKFDTTQRYLRRLGLDYAAEAKLTTPGDWLV